MQNQINPLVAVGVAVVIIALAVFFFVRSGSQAGGSGGTAAVPSSAYTHPDANHHP